MIVCDLCGIEASSEDSRLTWAMSFEGDAARNYCEGCARENLRSIEGRLEPAYW